MASAELTGTAAAPRRRFLSPPRRLQLVALVGLVAVWEIVSATGLLYRGVIPSTVDIAAALFHILGRAVFWDNVWVTLFEVACALAVGTVIGIAVGIALGGSRLVSAALQPLIHGFASTPKIIYLPLFYLFFGIGVGSKIAIGSMACFFPVAIGAAAGMRHINPVLVRVGRSFGLGWWQMVRKIYLPSLLDPILNGLRIAFGAAIGICLIAETRLSYRGLGFMVIDSYNRSRFAEVYAVLFLIMALVVAGSALLARLGHRRLAAPTTAGGVSRL